MAKKQNITNASLDPIYSRLNSVPQYHPLDASTFADWSMEAGDLVTVSRNGQNYTSPVHTASIKWQKGQQVKVSSTGNEKRDEINRMSQKKYNRGGSAAIRDEVWRKEVRDEEEELASAIELTAKEARLYTQSIKEGLEAGIRTAKNEAILYAKSPECAAEVIANVNKNGSNIFLNADHIYLNSSKKTKIADVLTINANGWLSVRGDMYVNGTVYPSNIGLAEGGTLRFIYGTAPPVYINLKASDVNEMIVKAQVSGDTLKLWKRGDPTGTPSINFRKATPVLSGVWSGGKLTVSSDPAAQANFIRYVAMHPSQKTWASNYKSVDIPIVAYFNTSSQYFESTGYTAHIDTSTSWSDGWDKGYAAGSGTIDVNTGGGSYHVSQSAGLYGLAYAMGTSQNNLRSIFGGSTVSSGQYYGFKVTCGGATSKYYYFVT